MGEASLPLLTKLSMYTLHWRQKFVVKVIASTADYPVGGAFVNEIESFFAESKKDEASPSSLLLTIDCESEFTISLSNFILVTCFMNK